MLHKAAQKRTTASMIFEASIRQIKNLRQLN